jgi:hypothetical protein
LEEVVPEIKIDIGTSDSPNSMNKISSFIPSIVTLLSTPSSPKEKVLVLRNHEERTLFLNSFPAGSPIYTSCKSEETSPRFPFPPLLDFTSPNDHFPDFSLPHPEEVERSPLRSLEFFENPLFNSRISSPRLSLVVVGGGGVGGGGGSGAGGGGGGQGQPPPPRIFSKLVARYAPLVLPPILHDLPKNYMKNLPKFTGEGDLMTTEHITFFD